MVVTFKGPVCTIVYYAILKKELHGWLNPIATPLSAAPGIVGSNST